MKHNLFFCSLIAIFLFSACSEKSNVNYTHHEKYIRECVKLAKSSREKGNHPFGALLVHEGKIILKAENTVKTDHDSTQHAELRLVSQACRKFPKEVLEKCILYTSTEPCAMCSGAIYWTGIRHVVFGCPTEILRKLAGGSLVIPCTEIFNKGKKITIVEGPVLEQEAVKAHEGFWK